MQGTPSSIGDIGQTGGIPATPSRSGIDPRIEGTAPASVETEVGENEGHNDAFVAAALVQGGFGSQEAKASEDMGGADHGADRLHRRGG